jgi:hypothetical protein
MKVVHEHILRKHQEDGTYEDLGRVVWVEKASNTFWWIPFPDVVVIDEKTKRCRRKHFIKAVRRGAIDQAEADESLTALEWHDPEAWSFPDAGPSAQSLSKSRRRLQNWIDKRDEHYALIKPIVEKLKGRDLVDDELVEAAIRLRMADLGRKDRGPIVRALRQYMLGGCKADALLPRWDLINEVGKPKHPRIQANGTTNKSGPQNKRTLAGEAGVAGLALTAQDKKKLRAGWKAYKRSSAVSVETAYGLTLDQYWALSVKYVAPWGKVSTLPDGRYPTIHQFRYHGPSSPEDRAARVNRGDHRWQRNDRPLRGSAHDGIIAAAQYAFIDATPDDQNLVSSASRLVVISTPWNTKVMEGYTHYIPGIQSGFEHPSTMTALMAIANAASSKVEFCARYGIEITDDEWMPLHFSNIRGDHGELKGAKGVTTLTSNEITTEFVRSYAAELKGPIESSHHSVARGSSHQIAGSTQGVKLKRGDEDPSKDACVTYAEYLPHFIRKILLHNNVERVEHLLTDEMRNDDVKPTRAEILRWMIGKGYVSTASPNMQQIRRQCLPRLAATIQGNGVHVFDPRTDRLKYIDGMVFWSEELEASGLTTRGRKKVIDCEIYLNPSDPAQAWLDDERLTHMKLRHIDPQRVGVTLRDWLGIQHRDDIAAARNATADLEVKVAQAVAIAHTNASAKKVRAAEGKAAKNKPAAPKPTKGEATAKEREYQRAVALGIDSTPPAVPPTPSAPASSEVKPVAEIRASNKKAVSLPLPPVDQDDDFMREVRNKKAA